MYTYIYVYTYIYIYEYYTVNPRHEAEWNRRIEEEEEEVEEDEESLRKIAEARMGQMEGREKEGWRTAVRARGCIDTSLRRWFVIL